MSREFDGKVVVVTGASRGIGAGIAKAFGQEGAKVVVNYSSSREGAERVVAEIRQAGGEAIAVHADIRKRTETEALFRATMEKFGRLDVLVNNAGVLEFRPLEEIDEDHYRRLYDLHVLGLLLCTQQAVKHMRNGASIVNVGSVSTKDRHANHLVYTGSKAAVDMMTSLMSIELGPRGIRVNAISPGMTPTEGLNALGIPQSPFRKIIEAKTPLGRIGTVEDSASATLFLASEKASWITGENLFVAGGVQ